MIIIVDSPKPMTKLISPDRRHSDSLKWKLFAKPDTDILPMWVADMDFASPPEVIAAIKERADHGVFGYTMAPDSTTAIVVEYLRNTHGQTVDAQEIVWLPGLVPALSVAARAVAAPSGNALIMPPVYTPFFHAPADGGLEKIEAPLLRDPESGRYSIDIDALEKAVTPTTKLLILCNPHNPVGRAFTKEELSAVANFCAQRDIVLCSDEVHCDLILDDLPHHSAIALEGSGGLRTITLMAPSKTYNIAGLGFSFAVIPDAKLRTAFRKAMGGFVPPLSAIAYHAAEAAYRHGEPWRQTLLTELRQNRDLIAAETNTIPGMSVARIEATYLAWIDCTDLDIGDASHAQQFFYDQAAIAFSKGSDYGDKNYIRMNFGCPTATMAEAFQRIRNALETHAQTHGDGVPQ